MHGPVLLSRVRVTESLIDDAQFSLTGKSHMFEAGGGGAREWCRHAMTLVGVRDVEVGGKRFLVQNWWKGKQFLEVYCAFVHRCGALASFITMRDFKCWPASVPIVHSRCVYRQPGDVREEGEAWWSRFGVPCSIFASSAASLCDSV
jgi:hypothetical protein